MRDVAPDVQANDGLHERRLFLILIDDAAISGGPSIARNVATIARGVIDKLGDSDMAAVVFTRDNRNSQDFTTDRARLLAAAEKIHARFPRNGPPRGGWWRRPRVRVFGRRPGECGAGVHEPAG